MARAICILNPGASRTKNGADVISTVFRRAGWNMEILTTTGPDDVRTFAQEGVDAGVDQIVVYGGDGTVMLAAAGVVGTGVPLGLLRGGTGNILAGNLRVPKNLARATKMLVAGKTTDIDIGRVDRHDGPHYFAAAAGAGFDAMMMFGTSAQAKRRWGMFAYAGTAVRILDGLQSPVHHIVIDGEEIELPAAMVLILNCSEFGSPFFRIGEGVRYDDGAFDVFIAKAESLGQVGQALWQLLRDTRRPRSLVRHLRGQHIQISSESPRPVELDGEAFGMTPLVTTVLPKALTVAVP